MIQRLLRRLNGQGLGAKLVRVSCGAFLLKITGAGTAFGVQLLLARILNASGYGSYVYVITCINFLTLPVILGFDTATLRFIPQYISHEKYNMVFGYIERSRHIVLLSALVVSSLATFYLQFEQQALPAEVYLLFIISFLLLPINGLIRLSGSVLQSIHGALVSQFVQVVFRPLLIALGVSTAYLYTRENLTEIAILANVVSGIASIIFLGIIVNKRLKNYKIDKKNDYETKHWFFVALPLLFNTGFNVILSQADILMIGYFLNQESVGVYAAVTKTASLVTFVLTAVNSIAAPMISQLYSAEKRTELQRIATLAARLTFFASLPICAFLIIWSNEVLSLFGREFHHGSEALVCLSSAQLFSALAGSVGFLMILTGHQHQANLILVIGAMVNVGANYCLIPLFGINGAAYATGISIIMWNFLMYIYTRYKIGINSTVLG